MLRKLMPLVLLPLIAFAQPAEARRQFWWESLNIDQPSQHAYGAPENQDLYGASDEQFNQRQYELYLRQIHRRFEGQSELAPQESVFGPPPSFYDQPDQPKRFAAPVYPQPKPKKIAKAQPAPPKAAPQLDAQTPQPNAEPQTAAEPALKSGAPVTCEKGASIVSGFGFENVRTKSCEAGTLAYNANRSGQPFEVSVNPKTGELIAVKKLPVQAQAQARTEL